jgi:hypothetical protein
MANYNLVADSTFTPFTFAEMVDPYEKYQAIYDKERDRYDELAANALSTLSMIDKEADPELYNSYSAYLDKLNTVGDTLAKGTLGEARQAGLYDLKREYYKQGLPITQAYALQQETKKLRESNPDRLYINPALKMSELMAGKRDNNTSVSKKDIIQHAIQANSTDIINDFMRGIEKKNLNVADIISKYQYNSEEDPFNIGDNTEAQNEAAVLYNDAVSSFVGDLLSKEYIPKAQREQMAWNKEKARKDVQNELKDTITISVNDGTKDINYSAKKVGDIWTIYDGKSWIPASTVTGAMEQISNSKANASSDKEVSKKVELARGKFIDYDIRNPNNFYSTRENLEDLYTEAPKELPKNLKTLDSSGAYYIKAGDLKRLRDAGIITKAKFDELMEDLNDANWAETDIILLWDHDWSDINKDSGKVQSKEEFDRLSAEYSAKKPPKNPDDKSVTPQVADTATVNTVVEMMSNQ